MNILITGGAGFIGSATALELIKKQHNVFVLDIFSKQIHGENYKKSYLYKRIVDKCNIINGDINDRDKLIKTIYGIDCIIHMAAETGTGQSMHEVNSYTRTNVMGLSNIFDVILKNGFKPKQFILSSSRSVYGEGPYKCKKHGTIYPNSREEAAMESGDFNVKCPICNANVEPFATNNDAVINPVSLYAFTKYAQENLVKIMCPVLDINYTILRYQNVFGPGQSLRNPYTGILSIFSTQLLNNNDINIFEDGKESRDFVYIDDVVFANTATINNKKAYSKIIDIGSGKATNVLTVANILKELLGSKSKIEVTGDFRKGDIRHNFANTTAARDILNYYPSVSFKGGIRTFSNWVKTQCLEKDRFINSYNEMKKKGVLIKKNG
ncbi:MAG: NAD-dependent epimerase/dehydratase family protein [Actinomycetia bacterium]|nr:NAD-dependent epimerase/dehydratase family protein [Actinomycetes bacterium]